MNERDWDNVARSFESEIFNVPAMDRKGHIKNWVQQLAAPSATITDLGCGVGRTLPMVARYYEQVYAVDVSSACLALAQRACAHLSNITYVHADLAVDRAQHPETDVVLCINTLLNADLEVRAPLFETTCNSVKEGGHLVLVVPSLNSKLLTAYRHVQWNLRSGSTPEEAEQDARFNEGVVELGIVPIDGVATKHYLREELEAMLAERHFEVEAFEKIEYPWTTEFEEPPKWMQEPFPWDWFVVARRAR